MTINETANKLVEYSRTGKWDDATNELYAENIVSVEPEHSQGPSRLEGLEAKRQKDANFSSMIKEYHGNEVSEPLIADNHITLKMTLDATMQDGNRMKMDEICVYRVNSDGKIDYEEFFYSAGS
ncbi:MAG: hypothetical protein Kapaf2KO_02510 [Candidatus Kapaibacteriales bacterium]